ncbi:hypothetical protein ACIA8F_09685 [Streptomyces sp. NPDC051563]|uniref:hypothetical protein n=1 Tax=Streptomyces sp. NPDC051563 TaxID=3365659 RepID=UPI0037954CB2
METATSQVIGQLSGYMRGLTQRLDPGTGWYGEFLRRDPEGMRACLDGAAMPPWDVLESLLGDLTASTGAMAIARETQYAAGLRAAAVAVWDRLPGGVEELRTLLASAAEQQARARSALTVLSARLAESADPAQAQALSRELSWTRDDAARAAARHEDLTIRLEAVAPAGGRPGSPPQAGPEPLHAVPAQRAATSPGADPAPAWPGPRAAGWGAGPADAGSAAWDAGPADAGAGGTWDAASDAGAGRAAGAAWDAASGGASSVARGAGSDGTPGVTSDGTSGVGPGAASAPVPEGAAEPVRRAEGRWLRGGRRSGGARFAGAAEPEARAVVVPPGHPSSATPLRGARFGRPAPEAAEPAPAGDPVPEQATSAAGAGHPDRAGGARYDEHLDRAPGAHHDEHTGQPRGTLHEPARTGAEGLPAGQPSAAPSPGGHTGPGGPHGAATQWSDAAPGGAPRGAAPQRIDAASGAGPHGPGVHGPGGASADPRGASPRWADGSSGDGPHGAAPQWAGAPSGDGPRGATPQWAGAPSGDGSRSAAPQWADAVGAGGPQGPAGFVEGLVALRGQGRSGEAHVLLCEAAAGPAERLVRLGEELGRAGLAADWATLLWEAASLPPARFAAAAAALGPADRDALLRQGAARPAAEIAEAALVLAAADHAEEADALLAAFVRVRTAEESARLARRDPRWFAPRLLRAAEALSVAHHRDLLHALRVANLPVA